jgi:Na+/H+ antiporter NhaD/arsenite permease-like protein
LEIHTLGSELPLAAIVPFLALLAAIAVLPLTVPRWWESNRNKGIVCALFAVPVVAYLGSGFGIDGQQRLVETAGDYASFVALIGSLFVIAGGIHVDGSLSGTPLMNTAFLGIGAILANLFGTTGASVLLIRPLLRANASRQNQAHVVIFFIFVVANCGGLLTPLGDPPLFLGFLKGVPFGWPLRLWAEWLTVNGLLLVVFNFWDQAVFDREERERPGSQLEEVMRHEPLRVRGVRNVAFLLAIAAVVLASGAGIANGGRVWPFGCREALMLAIAAAAYASTPARIRESNHFTFGPLIEVAVLFAGIFVAMAPALAILNARAGELGLREPWQFFWASGALSSFLDNAPTYLAFAAAAAGVHEVPAHGRYLAQLLEMGPAAAHLLVAVSAGSVFMGANSYIGNGPNFVVKAIAEEHGVAMPSFFGYLAYSAGILIPIFALVSLVFL